MADSPAGTLRGELDGAGNGDDGDGDSGHDGDGDGVDCGHDGDGNGYEHGCDEFNQSPHQTVPNPRLMMMIVVAVLSHQSQVLTLRSDV